MRIIKLIFYYLTYTIVFPVLLTVDSISYYFVFIYILRNKQQFN